MATPTTNEEQERAAFETYEKPALIDFIMLLKQKLREANASKTTMSFDDGVKYAEQLARTKDT